MYVSETNTLILETVSKWGTIFLTDLLNEVKINDKSEAAIRNTIQRLTNGKLLKNHKLCNFRTPIISLGDEYKKNFDSFISSNNEEIAFHDSLASSLCINLCKIPTVYNIVVAKDLVASTKTTGEIYPDAEIYFKIDKNITKCAFELELNQKNKTLVKAKFTSYVKSNYEKVFYFVSTPRIALTYLTLYGEVLKELNERNQVANSEIIILFKKTAKEIGNHPSQYSPILKDQLDTSKRYFQIQTNQKQEEVK